MRLSIVLSSPPPLAARRRGARQAAAAERRGQGEGRRSRRQGGVDRQGRGLPALPGRWTASPRRTARARPAQASRRRRPTPTPPCADPGPVRRCRSRRRRPSRSRRRGAFAARPATQPAEQQGDVGRDDGHAQEVSPRRRSALTRGARRRSRARSRSATSSARRGTISIPAERALTVFVDKRELVTLMTLGAAPELLVLGYLRNQRLVDRCDDIDSITVDWDVARRRRQDARRHRALRREDRQARRHHRLRPGHGVRRPDGRARFDPAAAGERAVGAPVAGARSTACSMPCGKQESTYKSAGSVHGCALFRQGEMLIVRRGRRPPQRDRHDRRLDVAARHRPAPTRSSTRPAG